MEEKKGLFGKLFSGLTKTRIQIMGGINHVLSAFSSIDDDFYEELEEALIMADIGVNTSMRIIEDLKIRVKEENIKDPMSIKGLLKEEIESIMMVGEDQYDFIDKKTILLLIGVNGVGKTTTIGKLANQYRLAGKKVILAAADTFRAGAIEQLKEWASRSKVSIISGQEQSDPAAVIYDAIASAKSKNADILICDTAGRLHNKKNLMDELQKIFRIINRDYPEAHKEVFIVLDSTTGQNALQQARQFKESADITGIVLTKLDGTAKGGISIAISNELGIPVKYIGVGEGIDDLQKFNASEFVAALFE
ncbi:MAG: signal recognition particle-docking protein FtsY [Vallitaleaceae bacterium]|jgi:fused signal recognition particle receptor|nr:signal recognition particle-docking protein FtsY [Vallitaleaceae bacterium]